MKKSVVGVFLVVGLLALLWPKSTPRSSTPFSLDAIAADLPHHDEWDARPLNPLEEEVVSLALSQPFHYLGSGGQCYTFVSQDETYVLKFFKQKAFAVPAWIRHYPIPFVIDWLREKKRLKRERHRDKVFSAFKLSFEQLSQETGLLYVHLNPTDHLKRTLHVTDASGATHELNADALEFVLQKKGVVATQAIGQLMASGDLDGAKAAIDALLYLQVSLYQKGFRNRDPNLKSNCAFIDSQPLLIDVGRVVYCEEIKGAEHFKKDFLRMTSGFRKYLADSHPELLAHFTHCAAKILEDAPS